MSLPLPIALDVFSTFSGSFWLCLPALISISDPLGSAIIFHQVTEGRSELARRILARKIGINSFIILLSTALLGGYFLRFFGITIDAVRIAGGLVIAVRAWNLLQAPEQNADRKQKEAEQDGRTMALPNGLDAAFFPLTMPFTIGPGCIAVAIALNTVHPHGEKIIGFYAGLVLAITIVSLTIWIAYSSANKIMRMLGRSGTRVFSRMAALVLLCIGVQIVATGVQGLLMPIFQTDIAKKR